jgi:predicted transcriptional regulator
MLKVGMRAMAAGIRVADVMTTEVTFLRTNQTLREAWQVLHDQSITGAPVLGARDRVVGIVSKADLADPRRHSETPTATFGTVGDVMTRMIFAVRARDPVLCAVKLMIDEDIHRAIVVTDNGAIAGIVTPMDILRALVRGDDVAVDASDGPIQFVDLRQLA